MSHFFASGGQSIGFSASNEYSGLISFRMDWLDLLAVQGTLKSLLRHHSSKASILRRSAFFMVQLSHPYMTTEKTIALTRRNFAGKVISLLFNMLSRLVITFLPRRLSTNVQQSLPKLNGLTHQQTLHYLSWICEFTEWFFCNFFLGWGAGGEVDSHAATVKWLLSWMLQDDSLICLVCWRDDERLGLLNLHITGWTYILATESWILNPKGKCAKEEMKAASPHRPRTGRGSLLLHSIG